MKPERGKPKRRLIWIQHSKTILNPQFVNNMIYLARFFWEVILSFDGQTITPSYVVNN